LVDGDLLSRHTAIVPELSPVVALALTCIGIG